MPLSSPEVVWIASTSRFRYTLYDVDGALVTGATVELTLLQRDDESTEVSGITWPLTMTETATGVYDAIVDEDAVLTEFQDLTAEIVATKATDQITTRAEVVAQYDRR